MIAEGAAIALWAFAGAHIARAGGLRGALAALAAIPVGAALHVALGTVVVGLGATGSPWLTSSLVLLTAIAVAWRAHGTDVQAHVRVLVAAAAAGLVAAIISLLLVPTITADSYRYLLTAGLLVQEGDLGLASSQLLQKRMIGLPLLHAVSGPDAYLVTLSPAIALSALGLIVASPRATAARLPAVLAAVALATNSRFVFHALYVNGHLLLATWLLLAILWARRDRSDAAGMGVGLLLAAIAVTRPEGILLALPAAIPFAIGAEASPRRRAWLVGAPGLTTALWYGRVGALDRARGDVPLEVLGPVGIGVALVVVAAMLWRHPATAPWLPRLAWAGPWIVLTPFVLADPSNVMTSISSTYQNVRSEAHWGVFLLLLAPAVVLALWRATPRLRWEAGYSLVTFVPVVLLLGYVREGAYRVGPGDSLARMLMHVVPLAVAVVVWHLEPDPNGQGLHEEA